MAVRNSDKKAGEKKTGAWAPVVAVSQTRMGSALT